MKPLLTAVVAGLALAAALLVANVHDASGARTPFGLLRPGATAPSAGSAPTLPETSIVAAHTNANTEETKHVLNANVIAGETTLICTRDANYFDSLKQAIDTWNEELRAWGLGSVTRPVLDLHTTASDTIPSSCADTSTLDIHVITRHRAPGSAGACPGKGACYWTDHGTPMRPHQEFKRPSDVPQRAGEVAAEIVVPDTTVTVATLMHELGHVLGLSDYGTCGVLRVPDAGPTATYAHVAANTPVDRRVPPRTTPEYAPLWPPKPHTVRHEQLCG